MTFFENRRLYFFGEIRQLGGIAKDIVVDTGTALAHGAGARLAYAGSTARDIIPDATKTVGAGLKAFPMATIDWATGNVKSVAMLGGNIGQTVLETGVLDPITVTATTVADAVRKALNLKEDQGFFGRMGSLGAAAISPLTGFFNGSISAVLGKEAGDDIISRNVKLLAGQHRTGHENSSFDVGVPGLWNGSTGVLKQTFMDGPIGQLRAANDAIFDIANNVGNSVANATGIVLPSVADGMKGIQKPVLDPAQKPAAEAGDKDKKKAA